MQDTDFHVAVGQSIRFAKTVSESDVYLFAGITGDLSDVHCNEQFMEKVGFREAHRARRPGDGLHVHRLDRDVYAACQ